MGNYLSFFGDLNDIDKWMSTIVKIVYKNECKYQTDKNIESIFLWLILWSTLLFNCHNCQFEAKRSMIPLTLSDGTDYSYKVSRKKQLNKIGWGISLSEKKYLLSFNEEFGLPMFSNFEKPDILSKNKESTADIPKNHHLDEIEELSPLDNIPPSQLTLNQLYQFLD